MKVKQYLLNEFKVSTIKGMTGHTHTGNVDEDGDGKTDKDNTNHVHKIYQWLIQPADGHVHNLKE